MQFFKKIRIGQRAVKTALSVGIALAVAQILGSSLPIFAAIGAISVMSRTWSDSLKESLTQVAGTFLGYLIACAFVLWLPWRPQFFLWMAVGTLCVITLCIALRLNFAIPLASIVFADVCLYTGGDAVVYGFHRFTDTMVGLAVALVVNIVIRPYNNRQKILDMMHELQKQFLPLLEARVIAHRYPDLAPLRNKMAKLDDELRIFEKQPVALFHHTVRVSARRQEAAYLRGCQQLLDKMGGELAALCNMDSSPVPDDKMLARLKEHGIAVPEDPRKVWILQRSRHSGHEFPCRQSAGCLRLPEYTASWIREIRVRADAERDFWTNKKRKQNGAASEKCSRKQRLFAFSGALALAARLCS